MNADPAVRAVSEVAEARGTDSSDEDGCVLVEHE
jgi:hypothetical protein